MRNAGCLQPIVVEQDVHQKVLDHATEKRGDKGVKDVLPAAMNIVETLTLPNPCAPKAVPGLSFGGVVWHVPLGSQLCVALCGFVPEGSAFFFGIVRYSTSIVRYSIYPDIPDIPVSPVYTPIYPRYTPDIPRYTQYT